MWLMLNPSTADDKKNDNTITRCINFAKEWGYGGIEIGNLYAYRTPHPKFLKHVMKEGIDPIGPENGKYLRQMSGMSDVIVAAWGAFTIPASHIAWVMSKVKGPRITCIGYVNLGMPRHPLYAPSESRMLHYPKEK
jgi:hypothetical protein